MVLDVCHFCTSKRGRFPLKTLDLIALLFLGIIALSFSSAHAGAIYANDDTYTYVGSSGSNYDDQGLIVKVSPTTRYGWIEFTIGTTAVPQATLKMYNRDPNTSDQNIELRATEYNFNESTLTWSNQPNADGWTLLGYWHVTSPTSWWTMNITTFYNNNLGKTITIRLKSVSGSGDSAHFEDREGSRGTGNRPFIEYPDCVPPSVTSHPVSLVKCAGQSATFSATVSGTTPSYQWRKNGTNITGATSSSYNIPSVAPSHAGSYDCVATNACGTVTSNSAILTVNTVPSITLQPVGGTIIEGTDFTFTVAAAGTAPLSYQWRKNTEVISSAVGATLLIAAAELPDSGSYDCVISNLCGSITSAAAVLTVLPPLDPVGLSNLNLGGGDWNYDANTGAGQKGIAEANGLNNIGALVRLWGAFSYVDATTFALDDGSGVVVHCEVPSTVVLNPAWEYVVVTGISSCYKEGDLVHRLVLVRNSDDILPVTLE